MTRTPVRFVCSALLGLPAALAAQAPKAASVQDALLADWRRDRANVLAIVDAMPEPRLGFRPTPGVRTFAEQVHHVVAEDVAAVRQVLPGATTAAPAEGDTAALLHHKVALRAWVAGSFDCALGQTVPYLRLAGARPGAYQIPF